MSSRNFSRLGVKAVKSAYQAGLSVLPLSLAHRVEHCRQTGRLPDVRNPGTHLERVLHRILTDRSPILQVVSSKYDVKRHLHETLDELHVKQPKTYWFGSSAEIRDGFESLNLPEEWVLKPNNLGGGLVLFGDSLTSLSEVDQFVKGADAYAKYFRRMAAVGWHGTRGGYLIEERIQAPAGLWDYKFHVFHGRCRAVSVYRDRFDELSAEHFTMQGEDLWNEDAQSASCPDQRLARYPEIIAMLGIAENLGGDFDYVRVDLYMISGQCWFGELTPFPTFAGLGTHPKANAWLGSWWNDINEANR